MYLILHPIRTQKKDVAPTQSPLESFRISGYNASKMVVGGQEDSGRAFDWDKDAPLGKIF